jgi:hypothetical protein
MLKTIRINAVYRNTSANDIIKALEKYAFVSNISMEEFETTSGGEYKRVFIDIESWHKTEDANNFILDIRNGRARLNYWWDVQENTKQKKEILSEEAASLPMDEGSLPMDEEYIYDDGKNTHIYEWKDVMSIMYGY